MKNDQMVLLIAFICSVNIDHIKSDATNNRNATDTSITKRSIDENCNNSNGNQCQSKPKKLLSRNKRYVAFPEGSSFAVTTFIFIILRCFFVEFLET